MSATGVDKGKRAAEDAQWEQHKDSIKDLYIIRDLPLREVIDTMATVHKFQRKKAQYERKFKQWNFGKNLRRSDMDSVLHRIEKRTAQNKVSEVRKGDYLLRKQRIERARYRNSYQTTQERFNSRSLSAGGFEVLSNEKELAIPSVTLQSLVAAATDVATHLFFDASSRVSASLANGFLIHGNSGEYRRKLRQITSLLPNTHESHDQLLCSGTNTIYVWLLVLVYKLSNNDLNTYKWAIKTTVEICRSKDALNFLQGLFGTRNPTMMAMAEKLLVCAVHQNDEVLTRIILQAGVSPNARFDVHDCLGTALCKRYKNLAILLIEAGADLGGDDILETAIDSQNDLGTIEYLLEHTKLDTKLLTGKRDYAISLEKASRKGSMELFQLILRYVNAPVYQDINQGVVRYIRRCLPEAAASGNQDLVRYLLSQGAQVADRSSYGTTGLFEAVNSGDISMVQLLLLLGADPNQPQAGNHHETPLQLAARQENIFLVKLLLDHGADPNQSQAGNYHETPLQLAARQENIFLVELLLEHGADPNQPQADNCYNSGTPLQLAAEKGNIFLVNLLLEHGADVHAASFILLKYPITNITSTFQAGVLGGNLAVIEALLEAGASLFMSEKESELQTTLQIACHQGSADIVHLLISKGAEVNVKSKDLLVWESALTSALRSKNYDTIEILLEKDADVNVPSKNDPGPSPLQVCIEHHGADMTERLLNLGADPDDSGALWAAVAKNKVEIVRLLLKHNQSSMGYSYEDSKTSNDYGRAALAHAIKYEKHDLVHILLEAGVDFRGYPVTKIYCDPFWDPFEVMLGEAGSKISALFMAVKMMDTKLVRLLLDAATDVDLNEGSRGPEASSALNFVDFDSPSFEEMSELVISKGASLNCYNTVEGTGKLMTPLQNAVYKNRPEAVQYLLFRGADINSPAGYESGRTALQIAAEKNYDHMIEILLNFNAEPNASPAEYRGATAIQFAAINGNFKNFQQLLEAGANIFARRGRKNGRTALEGAAEHGRLDMIHFILENSDRTEGLYFEHQLCRSIQLARDNGHICLAETIQSYRLERYRHSECHGHESVFVVEGPYEASIKPYLVAFPHRDFDSIHYDVALEEAGLKLSSATLNISSEKCDDSDDLDLENQESDFIASESSDGYDSFIPNQNTDGNILPSGIQGMEFDNQHQSDDFSPTAPELDPAIPVPNFDMPETADSTFTSEDALTDWTLDI
ncbi:hypothetical protein ACMFMG_007746 [Clarireedia jacksonii]